MEALSAKGSGKAAGKGNDAVGGKGSFVSQRESKGRGKCKGEVLVYSDKGSTAVSKESGKGSPDLQLTLFQPDDFFDW